MKKYTVILWVCLLLFSSTVQSQNWFKDSLKAANHKHSPFDYFSGDSNESIVCYKQAHRNIFFGFTLFSIVLLFITVKFLSLAKKSKRILELKNKVIEEKNKNITDSINYAKRLQNALLPSQQSIDKILPEHFIFYLPKDIVSGDFYWVSKSETKFIVAAVDCTGHGVPGSLLSVIGHNALDKAVNEMNLSRPASIIEAMHQIIHNILRHDENSDIRDGMDMALCTFDTELMQLEFAGANNPLYYINNEELHVVKAAQLSVGSTNEEAAQSPTNTMVQLNKGDCFYLFSDGYADQFGGPNNKKFKSKSFQQLLLNIQTLPMKEQCNKIKQTFESWKGQEEQIDDVLIIGIRV
jgi:phosphoserine phosphatase RsbU/P